MNVDGLTKREKLELLKKIESSLEDDESPREYNDLMEILPRHEFECFLGEVEDHLSLEWPQIKCKITIDINAYIVDLGYDHNGSIEVDWDEDIEFMQNIGDCILNTVEGKKIINARLEVEKKILIKIQKYMRDYKISFDEFVYLLDECTGHDVPENWENLVRFENLETKLELI